MPSNILFDQQSLSTSLLQPSQHVTTVPSSCTRVARTVPHLQDMLCQTGCPACLGAACTCFKANHSSSGAIHNTLCRPCNWAWLPCLPGRAACTCLQVQPHQPSSCIKHAAPACPLPMAAHPAADRALPAQGASDRAVGGAGSVRHAGPGGPAGLRSHTGTAECPA